MFTSYTAHGLPNASSRGNDSLSPYDYDGIQRHNYLGHWFPNAAGNGLWTYARNAAGQLASTTSYADCSDHRVRPQLRRRAHAACRA
jgi:hypothetical protein